MTVLAGADPAGRVVDATSAIADRRAEVERILADALARARAKWPGVEVAMDVFVAAIMRVTQGAPSVEALGELALDDLYLAQACAAGDPVAITACAAVTDEAVRRSLRAMRLSDDMIAELAQDVRTKLFVADGGAPRIETYSGRAALASWVRTIATRAAVDRLRRRELVDPDDDALESVPASAGGPELEHFRARYQAEFKQAFEEALASLEVRERNVLRHHFIDRLTVDAIGALYGVHKSTAFRWLEAARETLSKRTMNRFHQRVRATPSEMASIVRLLQSNIELSLSRVLS